MNKRVFVIVPLLSILLYPGVQELFWNSKAKWLFGKSKEEASKQHLLAARELAFESLNIYENYGLSKNADYSDIAIHASHLQCDSGFYSSAEDLAKKAISCSVNDVRRKILSKNALALAMRMQAKPADAEKIYLDCIEMAQKQLAEADPLEVLSMNNLADLYLNYERYQESFRLYKLCALESEKGLGRKNARTNSAYGNLGICLDTMGESQNAEVTLRECVEFARDEPPVVRAKYLESLGIVLKNRGKYDEASDLIQKAISIGGFKDKRLMLSNIQLIIVLALKGNSKNARSLFNAVFSKRLTEPVKNSPINSILLQFGDENFHDENYTAAELFYSEAVKLLRAKDLQETARLADKLGFIYLIRGDFLKAERYFRQALSNTQACYGESSRETEISKKNLEQLFKNHSWFFIRLKEQNFSLGKLKEGGRHSLPPS